VMVLICVEFMDQNGLSATPILARGAVYSLTTCTGLECGQHPYTIGMAQWKRGGPLARGAACFVDNMHWNEVCATSIYDHDGKSHLDT
jgi:hypothetical protein